MLYFFAFFFVDDINQSKSELIQVERHETKPTWTQDYHPLHPSRTVIPLKPDNRVKIEQSINLPN